MATAESNLFHFRAAGNVILSHESIARIQTLVNEEVFSFPLYYYFVFLAFSAYIGLIRKPTKPFKNLPMAEGCHWLLGHMYKFTGDFRKTQLDVFMGNANEYGQTGFWMGARRCISVQKWEDARAILHSEYYRRPVPLLKKHLSMFLGDRNIGVMSGREWRFHRSLIMKAFSLRAVLNSKGTVEEVISTLVGSIKRLHLQSSSDEVVLDIEAVTKMITMDVFGKAAFSKEFGCCEKLQASEAAEAFQLLGSELAKRIFNPLSIQNYFYSFPSEANRKHREARNYLRSILKEAIQQRHDDEGFTTRKDVLGLIVEANNQMRHDVKGDKEKESDLEQLCSDMMMVLLFAGHDTTSISLTYTLYLLSQHPEIEKLCIEEIESSPDELVYCKAVIMETLRMFPPATLVPRTLTKPVKISGNFVVPVGTQVFIPIWLIQQDPRVFPRPDEFRPDRWARREGSTRWVEREESDKLSSDIRPAFRKAFFAFSAGARSCPGQNFAMQETVLVLAGILKEFKFSTIPGYQLRPTRNGVVQRPTDGLPMRIQLRSLATSIQAHSSA